MHPEKLGFEDCDLSTIFKAIDKETQTINKPVVKDSDPIAKSYKLPLPRELEQAEEGTVKVFSFCRIIQDPECPTSITIIRESVTEECHPHSDADSTSNRYRYCKEVIKPYLKDYPPDCPDSEELLLRDAIIAATDDFPEYPPCYEVPNPKDKTCAKKSIPPKSSKDSKCSKGSKGSKSSKCSKSSKDSKCSKSGKSKKDCDKLKCSKSKSSKGSASSKCNKDRESLKCSKSKESCSSKCSKSSKGSKGSRGSKCSKSSKCDKSKKSRRSKKGEDCDDEKPVLVLCPNNPCPTICVEGPDCPPDCDSDVKSNKGKASRDCSPKRKGSSSSKCDKDCPAKRKKDCSPKRERDCSPKRERDCSLKKRERDCSPKRERDCSPKKDCKPKCDKDCPAKRERDCPSKHEKDCKPKCAKDCPAKRERDCKPKCEEEVTVSREHPECLGTPGPRVCPKKSEKKLCPFGPHDNKKSCPVLPSTLDSCPHSKKQDDCNQEDFDPPDCCRHDDHRKKDCPEEIDTCSSKKNCCKQDTKSRKSTQKSNGWPPGIQKSKTDCPNTKKDCLSMLLDKIEREKSDAETCTRKSKSSKHNMGCPEETKKCEHVPKTPPPVISIPTERCANSSPNDNKACSRRERKRSTTNMERGRDPKGDDDCEKKCRNSGSHNSGGYNKGSRYDGGRGVGCSSMNSMGGKPVKTAMEAHNETLATLKCAMEDFMCKIFRSTQDAVAMITNEGAKQIEKLKNSGSTSDRPPPKQVNNSGSREKLRRFSLVNIDGISNPPPKDCIDTNAPEPGKYMTPNQMFNKVLHKVDSALSIISDTLSFDMPSMKPTNFNDSSSKYDVPVVIPDNMPNPPKSVENLLPTPGPSTMFTAISTKIWSMFHEDEKKEGEISTTSSTNTATTKESDENLINKLIE
ncbi:unnamed protein product [Chrysodeixis includens]|uniref:Uncharacterized protein n=1 Tax=Chrysodeixis includens TaxID=689277 RepID=A0A9P0BWM2_CHRIL|nr:unnamed protein product [Chrysodeixis includens]